jgi:hypothetical protein
MIFNGYVHFTGGFLFVDSLKSTSQIHHVYLNDKYAVAIPFTKKARNVFVRIYIVDGSTSPCHQRAGDNSQQ